MDMLIEKTSVTKFVIGDRVIYVKIVWVNDENTIFQITIFDEISNWSGCFSTESAEECRKDVRETKEDYYKNVKMCLTDKPNPYVYKFNVKESGTATFEWSKTFGSKNIELVHGFVDLQKDTVTISKNELINFLLSNNQLQKKELEKSNSTINNQKLELEKLKAELNKLADMKTSLEDSLYGKFVTIINTKKRRIQALEDCLQKYEN